MAPTTVKPSSATPSHWPWLMCQATIASCPAVFISPLAKHWPTYTSALRVSRYWPLICGAEAAKALKPSSVMKAVRKAIFLMGKLLTLILAAWTGLRIGGRWDGIFQPPGGEIDQGKPHVGQDHQEQCRHIRNGVAQAQCRSAGGGQPAINAHNPQRDHSRDHHGAEEGKQEQSTEYLAGQGKVPSECGENPQRLIDAHRNNQGEQRGNQQTRNKKTTGAHHYRHTNHERIHQRGGQKAQHVHHNGRQGEFLIGKLSCGDAAHRASSEQHREPES